MASLSDIYIKVETLETLVKGLKKKGENGISITLSTNDESNQWGQNVSAYVSQSKEDRESKKEKFYVGNGRVFWENGTIKKAVKPEDQVQEAEVVEESDDDIPF